MDFSVIVLIMRTFSQKERGSKKMHWVREHPDKWLQDSLVLCPRQTGSSKWFIPQSRKDQQWELEQWVLFGLDVYSLCILCLQSPDIPSPASLILLQHIPAVGSHLLRFCPNKYTLCKGVAFSLNVTSLNVFAPIPLIFHGSVFRDFCKKDS